MLPCNRAAAAFLREAMAILRSCARHAEPQHAEPHWLLHPQRMGDSGSHASSLGLATEKELSDIQSQVRAAMLRTAAQIMESPWGRTL